MKMSSKKSQHVIGIDVGTTTVRALVYNEKGEVVAQASSNIEAVIPNQGWYEIDPDNLWEKVCHVIRECISSTGLNASAISSMGISCQRATFTTWSAVTGKHFHNLVTWKDIRADSYVNMWNKSLTMKTLRTGGKFLYWLTRMPRYLRSPQNAAFMQDIRTPCKKIISKI